MDDRAARLMSLVDAEDIDGVLAIASRDEIAQTWHRYQLAPEPKDYEHRDWWAVELFMTREIHRRTELYRELVLALVAHAGSDERLGSVGAGPLENIYWGMEDNVVWVESVSPENGPLRRALSNVWLDDDVPQDLRARFEAARA